MILYMTDGLILVHPKEDLTGRVFGKLTVIKQGPDLYQGGTRRAAWYCKCSCGNPELLLISGDSLRGSHTKSCGCVHKETCSLNNTYDLSGEYGICRMKDDKEFLFDLEDYNLIKQYTWHCVSHGYVGTTINYYDENNIRRGRSLLLHRLIMGVEDIEWKEKVVDHIDGNIYDNRKINLRIVSQQQNSMNHKIAKNNTSNATGVSFYKKNNKWGAHIKVNDKFVFLGLYEHFDDAVKARREAEDKYYGEFSYYNSQSMRKEIVE